LKANKYLKFLLSILWFLIMLVNPQTKILLLYNKIYIYIFLGWKIRHQVTQKGVLVHYIAESCVQIKIVL
jgi:hypothetical protein